MNKETLIISTLTGKLRRGSCQKCGNCCTVKGGWKEDLESDGTLQAMQMFGVNTEKLLSECKGRNVCKDLLIAKDKTICLIYNKRPKHCREFPRNEWESDRHQCKGFKFM